MTFTLTYAWWWIPAAISFGVIAWWLVPKNHGGNFPDIGAMFNLIGGLIIMLAAWAIGGILK